MLLLLLFHQQASKQARWDHEPVNFFALSFTTQVKLGWEDSICVVFFFPPSPSPLPPALENAHAPFFFFFWTAVAIHIHKNTKPEESHKVKAAAAAAATTTTTFVLLRSWILPLSSCPGFLQTHSLYTEKTKTKQKKLSQESEEKRKTQLCKTQNTLSTSKPNPKKQQNKSKQNKTAFELQPQPKKTKKTVGRNKIELAWPNWKSKHTLQKQTAMNHKNAKMQKCKIKIQIQHCCLKN